MAGRIARSDHAHSDAIEIQLLCRLAQREKLLGTPFLGHAVTLYGCCVIPNGTLGFANHNLCKDDAANTSSTIGVLGLRCRQTIKIGSISLVRPYNSAKLFDASPSDASAPIGLSIAAGLAGEAVLGTLFSKRNETTD